MGTEESKPGNIHIAGIDYEVEYKKLHSCDGFQLGWCHYGATKIEINNEVKQQRQAQTLIHEMTHAIFHEAGLDEEALDERIVNSTALVLFQVLKDNDFTWLRK